MEDATTADNMNNRFTGELFWQQFTPSKLYGRVNLNVIGGADMRIEFPELLVVLVLVLIGVQPEIVYSHNCEE